MSDALFHGDMVETQRIIYTPSEFAKLSLFHVQEIGTLQAELTHVSKRDKLDSYLFFIVHSGSGTLTYEGATYNLIPGDCVFIDCKKSYSHETSKNLWKLSWIHFNGPSAGMIYQKYKERGGEPVFHPLSNFPYLQCYVNLKKIISEESYVRDMKINEELSRLLTILMEDSWNPEKHQPSSSRYDLLEIKKYLDDHFQEKISLDNLSQLFFINKYYLTRVFKEQFGTTINSYLTTLRITQAKSDLRFSDKSIEQIGLDAGIGTGNYFSRTFSKIEGQTPGEYRNSWRNR